MNTNPSPSTRFKPGSKPKRGDGKPIGGPRLTDVEKTAKDDLRKAIYQVISVDPALLRRPGITSKELFGSEAYSAAQMLALSLMKRGIEGSIPAMALILDRILGKVPQPLVGAGGASLLPVHRDLGALEKVPPVMLESFLLHMTKKSEVRISRDAPAPQLAHPAPTPAIEGKPA